MRKKIFFVLCVLAQYARSQYYPWRILPCPFDDWRIGTNSTESYSFEYANVGDLLQVPCCQRYPVNTTKKFYKRTRFFTDEEKPLRREYDELIWYIGRIKENLTGAYYCKDEFATTNAFTYVYFIDIDYPNATTLRGRVDAYVNYTKTYLNPLNEYLRNSNDLDLLKLAKNTGLGLVAEIRWEPWTECDFCTKEKTRKGRCHLRPVVIDDTLCIGLCEMYKHSLHVDCRSYWTIEKLFPALALKTKDIPHFLGVAKCVGPCLTDVVPGYDYVKKLRTRILNVGDSVILSCPGFTRKKMCYWRQNGAKLTSNEFDPFRKVSINELCMLYLNEVTKDESGNFTCYLDDQMIQQNNVIVEILYLEKNKAWQRHVIYLLYVVLLCFIIIVAGIAIGFLQKENFQKINAEELIEMYATRRLEHERLLPPES